MKKLYKTADLASIFKVTDRTIQARHRAGMPCERPGGPGIGPSLYDLQKCTEWFFHTNSATIELMRNRARLASAQAVAQELRTAQQDGGLMFTRHAIAALNTVRDYLNTKIATMPAAIAPAIHGKSAPEIEIILRKAIHDLTTDVGNFEFDETKN